MSELGKTPQKESQQPTLKSALIFRAKTALLQLNRALRGADSIRFPQTSTMMDAPVAASSTSLLWTENDEAEKALLLGKSHNLRLALRRLNGVEVPAQGTFSFWRHVGRPSRWKGYVEGRELREGCIIPSIGGGLCQLSNALYDAAVKAGFEIVERHAHSQVIPGSLAEANGDATVFWNYVDLRFKSSHSFRIEVTMDADSLTVTIRGRLNRKPQPGLGPLRSANRVVEAQSCASCGVHECFRHKERKSTLTNDDPVAYLVDEYWPEFDRYISETKRDQDHLFIPIDGHRFGKPNYAWNLHAFHIVRQSRIATTLRSFKSRRLYMQGAARQRALLAFNERLAASYAARLKFDTQHVVVMQNLLPFLWENGHLGGRTFDVLMTSLPLTHLHERLDFAAALHPECATLADFRADDRLVRAEAEALLHARKIVTPHSEIAGLYKNRVTILNWAIPAPKTQKTFTNGTRPHIVFPAAIVGRKGAYELRTAIEGFDLQLTIVGSELEGNDFWRVCSVNRKTSSENWLTGVTAVVLPAFIEHKPRRLLEALAHGIPVLASTACGLGNTAGVATFPFGDVTALRAEIAKTMALALSSDVS